MDKTIDIKEWYISKFTEFEKALNGEKASDFHKVRKNAIKKI